ncbi:B12-binding domain-containing protein [Caenispirillum salinarum]|uniref:cobalamin B12-binding domain-containing protein n=1 Tax=Caenispirillum salinarum TaxID=859058 RepID=UPI00384E46FA
MDVSTRDALVEGRGAADDQRHGALGWSLAAPEVRFSATPPVILPGMGYIRHFADLAMKGDAETAVAHVQKLHAAGFTAETLCTDLLGPVARRLGVWWEEDLCSFADVTLGCCNLQQALHALGPRFTTTAPVAGEGGRTILLCPVPGEQHGFGLSVVAAFLRRAGWVCARDCFRSGAALAGAVRRRRVGMVGLSASCERHLNPLTQAITAVRRSAGDRPVQVLVGGALFVDHPEWAVDVGADAMATDGHDAVLQAETLLAMT